MKSDVPINSSSSCEQDDKNQDLYECKYDSCMMPKFQKAHVNLISLVVNELNEVVIFHNENRIEKELYVCIATNSMYESSNVEDAIAFDVEKKLGLDVQSVKYLSSCYHNQNNILHLGYVCKVNKEDFHISRGMDKAVWMNMYEACKSIKDCSLSIFLLKNFLENI
ncbi:NUDIX hydrolase [Anaeromicropila herbilytica]|uniref:Uncharacterized protein n=1 Tax=Anaeromicropila herbilytica TaxID=2785025 RepID=A0A7R7EMG5_9FIRM|nr:hypothetical protein [Anaeromicropila herbilytica]BCN31321.1 hypothetical protein bsdtb5_26160 [Anaeromicropila herbilytica]